MTFPPPPPGPPAPRGSAPQGFHEFSAAPSTDAPDHSPANWGKRLSIVAAILMLVPIVLDSTDTAALISWSPPERALWDTVLPAALALALGILAERAPAWTVLSATILYGAQWLWGWLPHFPSLAEIFAALPVETTFTALGVAAGIAAFWVLRAQGLPRIARTPHVESRVIGMLGGLLFVWSQLKDENLAFALLAIPPVGGELLLMIVPVGLGLALILAAVAGTRRMVLATTIAFFVVWVWGMVQYSEWLAWAVGPDVLGCVASVVGAALGVASYALSREPARVSAAPEASSPPAQATHASVAVNPVAVIALVLAWVPLVGVVLGHLALSSITRTGERGRGLAIGALALSYPWSLLAGAYGLMQWVSGLPIA